MNTLKRLKFTWASEKRCFPIVGAIGSQRFVTLVPAVLVWFIVRTLINSGGTPEGTAVYQYAWWAFVAAVFSVLLYFVALMLSHLAAFRVECNLRTTAVNRLLHMPLGFFENKASGRIRKSSTTMPEYAYLLGPYTARFGGKHRFASAGIRVTFRIRLANGRGEFNPYRHHDAAYG